MSQGDHWTPARIEQLRAAWLRGDTVSTIARAMALTSNQVIGKVHRLGDLPQRANPLKVHRGYAWTDEQRAQIHELRAAGCGYRRMSRVLGVSEVTVLLELRRLGFHSHPRPRAKKMNGHKPPAPKSTPAPRPPRVNFGALARQKPHTPIPVIVPIDRYIPRGGCLWPMWSDTEAPTHEYCGAPLETRQYCKRHADRAYVRHPQKNQWNSQ